MGHRRADSVMSDPSRRTIISLHAVDSSRSTVSSQDKLDMVSLAGYEIKSQSNRFSICEKDEAGAEFDELMKSASTMKVSLTPDRLKTFEVSYGSIVLSPATVSLARLIVFPSRFLTRKSE